MKLHSILKIALFSMLVGYQANAAMESVGIDCIESGNNSTTWKVHRKDNGPMKFSIYKTRREYDRMTYGSRWGCDVHIYTELTFEEDTRLAF